MDVTSIQRLQPGEQIEAYERLIANVTNAADLKSYIDHILDPSTSVSLFVARPIFSKLIEKIAENEELLVYTLEASTPRLSTFEEQICQLRETLATRYEAQQEYLEAARVLQNIPLESGQRVITDQYKLRIYIRIIRCLLEEDEAISADSYLNRASLLVDTNTDPETVLHFKLSQARIFDAKRRFMEASQKYLELSLSGQILESERAACFEAAITCAVLAPAGPVRSRLLSTLYKDDRANSMSNHKILEKMFLDRVIAKDEVAGFAASLKPHQMALLADGTTVLSRAVIEHNLLSASRLYENVRIVQLGELLGLSAKDAEKFARGMIESKRLQGEIDQVSGIIEFTSDTKLAMEGTETERWDKGIETLLTDLESVAVQLEKKYPEWVASRQQTSAA